MNAVRVEGVFIGKAEEIGPGLSSAIDKRPIPHRLWLWPQGLATDEQGDLRFHGGPERAVHHYPAEHYLFWQQQYPQLQWRAPTFGENLSTRGLCESDVCIGDVFRWGDALIQVSQPRSPCYRLSHRWGIEELPLRVQNSGRCGWFYRVLKPGFVGPENGLHLMRRAHPGLSVARVVSHFFHFPLERSGLRQLVECPALSARWRDLAAQRLASGKLEDWSARLQGLAPVGLRSTEAVHA